LGLVDEEVHIMITSTILTLRSFLPLVRAGQEKKIVQISSELGSIEKAVHLPGLNDIYSVCRAAINMMIRKWAGALKGEGITAVVVHPGKSCVCRYHFVEYNFEMRDGGLIVGRVGS
jgi:NAD(P)-dependent dehydrogenase (short-subunit alcohol dehydrogenase family)